MLSTTCAPCPSIFFSLFFLRLQICALSSETVNSLLYSMPTEMDVPAYLVELQGRLVPVIGGMQA